MNLRKDHYRFDLNDHTENSCEGLGVVLIFLKKNREDAERRDPKFSRPSYFFSYTIEPKFQKSYYVITKM